MPLAAVLAWGGIWVAAIVIAGVGLFIMAIYAVIKMRKDEFWEDQG
jgi:hypothetical protein